MLTARRVLTALPGTVLVVLAVLCGMPFCATCGGHDEAVTAAIRACPRAVELLGEDPGPSRIGLACGSTETSGGFGTASWNLPYSGSRQRGTVSFNAEKRGGDWKVLGATLEVDGEELDVLACSRAASAGGGGGGGGASGGGGGGRLVQTNADAVTGSFEGKVLRSSHPAIAAGATCSGTLRRERGATTAQVTVRCKGGAEELPLYDGSGTFELRVGDPSRRDDDLTEYEDKKLRAEDETPGCRISSAGSSGTLTVWDAAQAGVAAFEIVVGL